MITLTYTCPHCQKILTASGCNMKLAEMLLGRVKKNHWQKCEKNTFSVKRGKALW